MKITITITNCKTGSSYDVQMDNKQKIKTTLRILEESLSENWGLTGDKLRIKANRSKRNLSLEQTYEEAHVYSGDIILLQEKIKQ